MLNKVKTLKGYSIQSTDGETIGTVKDFYFDDRHWTVRYLVANTGNWLTGRQVLVSPYALVTINNEENPIKSLMVQEKNMQDESLYKDSGIQFTAIENNRFGNMDAKSVRYESLVKGIKVSGTIYCFNCAEKTYLLFFQTGTDDIKKNTKAFKLIELTFACR